MSIKIQKEFDTDYFDFLQKKSRSTPEVDPTTLIVFLDVDGVLNCSKWIDMYPDKSFDELIDPDAVARLNRLLDRTGAKIIISSSWRVQFLNVADGFNKLTEFFGKHGIKNIIGMTPRLHGKRRCDEITEWLNHHPVESFVILDDDLSANVKNRQVKTFFETGLQDYHIDEAIEILARKL